ncbi:MAG: hypothetical protein KDK63_05130, partial [Chlamydiia bacterium]|nr:hypothetical protein [Chlamydiia bacterium]
KENGQLNLKYMIRENLKNTTLPSHLPPYTMAEQIARKLSECIASFEGKKPQLSHLTKIIWSIQKHLLKDLSAMQTKNPYEEYDKVDKIIVKTLLEILANEPLLAPEPLKREVVKHLKELSEVKALIKNNQLTSTLSMILAEKLYQSSLINCHFSLLEKQNIEAFIRHHIDMGKCNELLSQEDHRLELIQRVLALYTLAGELPKDISKESLFASIRHIRSLSNEKNCALTSNLDQALFVFINAEIHLMDEEKAFAPEGEEAILIAYEKAIALPTLSPLQKEQFELLIWKMIEEEGNLLLHVPPLLCRLLEKELGNILIDQPKQSFKEIISAAVQFFKKAAFLSFDDEKTEDKIEAWVSQNDMLIRTIHFDPKAPLLKLVEQGWNAQCYDEHTIYHKHFVEEVKQKALKTYPILLSFEEELSARIWILYKYLWYTTLSDGCESTFERFMEWHKIHLKNSHPEWPQEKISETLAKLSDQILPLVPYAKKQ